MFVREREMEKERERWRKRERDGERERKREREREREKEREREREGERVNEREREGEDVSVGNRHNYLYLSNDAKLIKFDIPEIYLYQMPNFCKGEVQVNCQMKVYKYLQLNSIRQSKHAYQPLVLAINFSDG